MVKTINRSCCREVMRRRHFEPIMALVPISVPPIAITLFGLISCLGIPLAILLGARRDNPLFSLMCAAATYFYMVADHLDGMQSRRAGSGTYRGSILDHLCDFVAGSLIMIGVYWATGTSASVLIVVSFFYVLAFSIVHLEVVVRDEFRLGVMGPLEGLLIVLVFFISMSIGPSRAIWQTGVTAIGGIPVYWVVFGYFLYKFIAVALSSGNRMRGRISRRFIAFAGCMAVFGVDAALSNRGATTAIWAAMIIYAGGYVLKLLIADPGNVPIPGAVTPVAVTAVTVLCSDLSLSAEMVLVFLVVLSTATAADLMLSAWRLPRRKVPAG